LNFLITSITSFLGTVAPAGNKFQLHRGRTTSPNKRNTFQKIIKETETIKLLMHTLREMALLKLHDKAQHGNIN